MKLTIGENIREYRKKNGMTQEDFAERLGVSYQSVSRWENGATYPDLELLPSIARILEVTMDELMGIPEREKEKQAAEAFDDLRRECLKREYDADRIVSLLRDIRRNYMNTDEAWRPWVEGNNRAFQDPKILPEVRLLAEARFAQNPTDPHVIETMAEIEDEEHLPAFLEKHATPFDCSARKLLFNRYWLRADAEHFEPERRYQLFQTFGALLYPSNYIGWSKDKADNEKITIYMDKMLSIIRQDAADERPDIWLSDRMELGIAVASILVGQGHTEAAMEKLSAFADLLEDTMAITDEIELPTSSKYLEGMKWIAREDWMDSDNNPDSPEERMIYISAELGGMTSCYCIFPTRYLYYLNNGDFDKIKELPAFKAICERVQNLVVRRPKQAK